MKYVKVNWNSELYFYSVMSYDDYGRCIKCARLNRDNTVEYIDGNQIVRFSTLKSICKSLRKELQILTKEEFFIHYL